MCLRLCNSAAGALSGSLVRKIAVPGTEAGACALLRSIEVMKADSGMSVCWVRAARMRVPRRHVHMINVKVEAIITGT